MPIFKRLFGSERKAATKPDSTGAVGASRSTGRGLIKLISGRPSLLSDITAALGRPPVDGAILLDDITKALRRHVWLPDDGAEIVALFVLHAHAREAARISPMLAFASPEIACGKTTALSVVSKLTPQPLFVSDLTPAGLYRAITNAPCTLLIDEGKSALRGHRTLSSLLNSGHRRDGARVLRADGVFDLYCPKAIALVGELPASLRDRALLVALKRKRPNEAVAPLDEAAIAHLEQLGVRTATWADQQFKRLADANPVLPAGLANRSADNWRPLLAIADAAGGRWPELARSVASRAAAAQADDNSSPSTLLLSDLRDMFCELNTDRLATDDVIYMLPEREEHPWANYHRGRPITANDVARLLRPFGIRPKTLRFGPTTAKGYFLADFHDAFDRYLPSAPAPR